MTVTYTSKVTTSTGIGCFLKLLIRWRGSIYKLIWPDIFIFMALYYAINLTYRLALDDTQKILFEQIVHYCEKYGSLIPLSFVLGFYVNLVMTRWWSQYTAIPFPDDIALLVSASVKGNDDHARIVRRTLMRYICLSFTMTLSMISPKVKKRFPTLGHLVEAGLLEKDEKKIIEDLDSDYPSYSKYWLPLAWASNIVTRARHEGLIRDDPSVNNILGEINKFRTKCGTLLDYDWISVPLVYTQVVTLAVYTYFMTAILGMQWIEAQNKDDTDLYFPVLLILEFFFYMGWLKVAETLINPFGDDDDDFEVVWMIDRHVQVTYLIVDKIHHEHPKLMKDQYWIKMAPNQLPHTLASEQFKNEYPKFSTNDLLVDGVNAEILPPDQNILKEKVDGKGESFIRKFFRSSKVRRTNAELHRINSVTVENREDFITSECINNCDDNDFTEFNQLRKQRRILMKQKVLHCFEMLKDQTDEEKRKLLVEEILNSSVDCSLDNH